MAFILLTYDFFCAVKRLIKLHFFLKEISPLICQHTAGSIENHFRDGLLGRESERSLQTNT